MRKKIARINYSYTSVSDIQRKTSGFLSKISRQGCQNCILRIHGNILKNFFWKKVKFLNHFRTFSGKVRLSVKKFSAGLTKMHSTYPCQHIEKLFLEKSQFFLSFSNIERKISAFCRKALSRVNKTAIYVSSGTL